MPFDNGVREEGPRKRMSKDGVGTFSTKMEDTYDSILGTQRKIMAFKKPRQGFIFLDMTMWHGLSCKKC